jgi:hypothetical protein
LQLINHISQKETIDLLNKCWMTHDGMWFFHCLQEFGIDTTNKINKSAIKSLSSIEIQRIKNTPGVDKAIDNYDDFRIFFEKASKLLIPDFMHVAFRYPEKNKMAWAIDDGECFAYTGIKRIGAIDRYECGVLYRIKCWLEALGIRHRFNPEIGRCLMHHRGKCSGEIQLFL